MNLREKILAGVGGAVIFGWWISPTLYSFFLEPFDRAQFEITNLSSDIKKLQDKEMELIKATSRTKDAKTISLPPDPIDAQRLYQRWLTELANLADFKDVSVVPKRRTTKGDIYTSVQVSIDAKAGFVEVSKFLELFEQADLLHRVSELNLTSNSASDDSPLTVHVVAEGLSLPKAVAREMIFPRTKLLQQVSNNTNTLIVEKADLLPKTVPYLVKLDNEIVEVKEVQNNKLTISRGALNTKPLEHAADAQVEYFPQRKNYAGLPPEITNKLAKLNPFIKYQPLVQAPPPVFKKPKLKSLADMNILQGDPLKKLVQLEDWRPELGKINYSIKADKLSDLAINQETGEISLEKTQELMPESYVVSVQVQAEKDPDIKLTGSFKVNVKQLNHEPIFEPMAPSTAYQEQSYKTRVTAKDQDASQKLTYSLGASKIPTIELDAATGDLRFTPGLDLAPGMYAVEVKVTDNATPPATVSQTIEIPIAEDPAKYTYLVANILDGEQRVIWLYNRLDNVRYELKEVDLFAIGDLFGAVGKIEYDYVILGIDGDFYRLQTGQNLRQMVREPTPVVPKSMAPEPEVKTGKGDSVSDNSNSPMHLPPSPKMPES